MLKKIYITIVAMLLMVGPLLAQGKKESSLLLSARKNYQQLRYIDAIKYLIRELKVNPAEKEAQEMIADSYRKIKDYDNALHWYAELTKTGDIKPVWALCYAEALANKQQYKASQQWYDKYVQLVIKNESALAFSKAYNNVDLFLTNSGNWKISYLNINTAASEYSPMYFKDGLLFVSNRKMGVISKRVFEWDKTPFSDIYYVEHLAAIKPINPDSVTEVLRREIRASGKKLYKVNDDDTAPTSNDSRTVGNFNTKLLKDTLGNYLSAQVDATPLPGNINSKYHEGPTALLPDGAIIFTRNNYFDGKYLESKEGINKLKLFTAKSPDYDAIEPFAYNNDQYSVGHPAVNKAGTLLIFSSDMPGGFGGTDLYYSTRATTNDAWGKPVNMGPVINTTGNEMFPGLYRDSILYFSSTGHAGLGGLDIFQVTLSGTTPLLAPVNLGAPINSSVDDFGLIRDANGKDGFFTSNRKGSDDIYSFKYLPFSIKLKGLVVDALTNKGIENSTVTLLPGDAGDLTTNEAGGFQSQLKSGIEYRLTAAKEGYTSVGAAGVSTVGITSDTTLTVLLKLNKVIVPQPIVKVPNCDSLKQLIALKKLYYNLDKSFIRADAAGELDHLISVLKQHPNLKATLASYCDTRASVKYNIALSLRRSQSARAYLLKNGIDKTRLKIEYFGKSHLVNGCADGVKCTEAEHQLNRRTEISLTNNGKELQSMDCDELQKALK